MNIRSLITVSALIICLPAVATDEKKLYQITSPMGETYVMQADELYGWVILTDPKNPEAGISIMRDGKLISSVHEALGYRFITIEGSNNPLGGVRVSDKDSDGYLDEITYFPKDGLTVDADFDGQADSKMLSDESYRWHDGQWQLQSEISPNQTLQSDAPKARR